MRSLKLLGTMMVFAATVAFTSVPAIAGCKTPAKPGCVHNCHCKKVKKCICKDVEACGCKAKHVKRHHKVCHKHHSVERMRPGEG